MRISISACVWEGRIAQWKFTTRSGTHIQRPGWGGQVNLLGPAAADLEFAAAVHMDLPDHNGGSKKSDAVTTRLPSGLNAMLRTSPHPRGAHANR
jgi:nicotinate dehydrogenase subunit B